MMFHMVAPRKSSERGIAIGPILFVVAILGVLAAAIAAGSGSFTTSTTQESNRTKASALIEIGNTLKTGFDRVVGLGTSHTSVIIDPDSTVNDNDLFSPTGGGVSPPSVTMGNTPATDVWYYPVGALPGFGTTGTERIAMIRVASGVCDQVNSKASAVATPAAADVGNVIANDLSTDAADWPDDLQGKIVGCVNNSNTGSTAYWFYQVLGIQ